MTHNQDPDRVIAGSLLKVDWNDFFLFFVVVAFGWACVVLQLKDAGKSMMREPCGTKRGSGRGR